LNCNLYDNKKATSYNWWLFYCYIAIYLPFCEDHALACDAADSLNNKGGFFIEYLLEGF